jgi:hypothetical protein
VLSLRVLLRHAAAAAAVSVVAVGGVELQLAFARVLY